MVRARSRLVTRSQSPTSTRYIHQSEDHSSLEGWELVLVTSWTFRSSMEEERDFFFQMKDRLRLNSSADQLDEGGKSDIWIALIFSGCCLGFFSFRVLSREPIRIVSRHLSFVCACVCVCSYFSFLIDLECEYINESEQSQHTHWSQQNLDQSFFRRVVLNNTAVLTRVDDRQGFRAKTSAVMRERFDAVP